MPWISAQLLSPVTATAFRIFANAKQARSANDNPSGLVIVVSLCKEASNAEASKIYLLNFSLFTTFENQLINHTDLRWNLRKKLLEPIQKRFTGF